MPHLQLNGARLFYRLDGHQELPVLVLSNALGTQHEMWELQVERFSEHFRLLRYDCRGHGRSDVPPGPYSIEDMARDVLALMDQLELDRVCFCGLSLGGMVGIWLGAHAPERITKLVLCNTAAQLGSQEMWNERIRIAQLEGMASLADAALERWLTPAFRERYPDATKRVRQMLVATPADGYAAAAAAVRDMDQRDALAALSAPTLIIAGTQDPATTPELARFMRERIPNARLVELDAAHLSNLEAEHAFTDAVLAFLLESP